MIRKYTLNMKSRTLMKQLGMNSVAKIIPILKQFMHVRASCREPVTKML
jgi:hypothetical protein